MKWERAWACSALAVAVVLGAGAATASGNASDGGCLEECGQARAVCEKAAKAAFVGCRSGCEEAVAEAALEAAAICQSQGLDDLACARLTRRHVSEAREDCRRDCGRDHARARRVCREARHECRAACAPPADPACVTDCRDGFASCRDDLETCQTSCRDGRAAALDSCREGVSDTCDPEAFRECVHQARIEARDCDESCHDDHPCAADLRECLRDCVPQADGEAAAPAP